MADPTIYDFLNGFVAGLAALISAAAYRREDPLIRIEKKKQVREKFMNLGRAQVGEFIPPEEMAEILEYGLRPQEVVRCARQVYAHLLGGVSAVPHWIEVEKSVYKCLWFGRIRRWWDTRPRRKNARRLRHLLGPRDA